VEEEGDVASCCCGWFYFVGICNGICKGNKYSSISLKMICLIQIILTNMMDKTPQASLLHFSMTYNLSGDVAAQMTDDRRKNVFFPGDVAAQLEMIWNRKLVKVKTFLSCRIFCCKKTYFF